MAIGQNEWLSQGSASKDFIVQALLNKTMYSEIRDADAFGTMELLDPDSPKPNGLADSGVDVTGTGAVLTQVLDKNDEARFSLRRNLTGAATYGDTSPGAGDTFAYLHQNFFINEVDSKWVPIMGRQSQRRVGAVILDHKSPVLEAIKNWHIEERSFDFHSAILDGADLGQYGDPATIPGALGKTLGLASSNALPVGTGAPIEHFYYPSSGQATKVVVPANGPRTTDYRTNYITALKALKTAGNQYITRQSLTAIAQIANDLKIKQVRGADWDYELIVDPALMTKLLDSDSDLMTQFKTAQQGQGLNGQKSLDVRGAVMIDGLRIIPDKGLAKWRPYCGATTGLASDVLTYGDGSRDRRNASFVGPNYIVGFAVLLGGGALLQATDGSLETIQAEDEAKKGWKAYGRINRGIKRSLWLPKDGQSPTATDNWLQQSMVGFAFNIATTPDLI